MATPAFTDRELDVMAVLWSRGPSTVAEVRERLSDDLAHNTVQTILRILEDKGYVGHTEEGRAHRFHARVKREILTTVPGITVQTWEEVRAPYLRAVNNEKVLLLIVLSFIILLAGFTILATLTLTVVEKTRDIGLLKAIGATTGGVLSLFLRSGLMIGVFGGVLGIGLGRLVERNVNGIKDALSEIGIQIFPPDIYLFREIPHEWGWTSVAAIFAGGVGIAFLAGLPPALRAARMDPVVALRHE